MENFREFDAGPDPFGRTWRVYFKYLQTGISIRHSDTVDVQFILTSGESTIKKTIAMLHADLLALSKAASRPMTDAWCSRLAMLHLKRMIESGEDLEKDLVTVSAEELAAYDEAIRKWEYAQPRSRKGAA